MECEECGFKDAKAVGAICPKCGSHKVRNSNPFEEARAEDQRYSHKPIRGVTKK